VASLTSGTAYPEPAASRPLLAASDLRPHLFPAIPAGVHSATIRSSIFPSRSASRQSIAAAIVPRVPAGPSHRRTGRLAGLMLRYPSCMSFLTVPCMLPPTKPSRAPEIRAFTNPINPHVTSVKARWPWPLTSAVPVARWRGCDMRKTTLLACHGCCGPALLSGRW